ncbi:MAG: hypothetical protein A3J38_09910 [Gammaproteobacteria bacterium RIFCSPHIGHO2_12_FULL_45_9]|nr:MAG: hypothetical protein A3J38_09910 [Gammaproteobacteria bacterium RIFCSPHIGHO2_12_FULL_45_9]
MKKFSKLIAVVLAVIIVCIVIAAILLVTLVSPNRFKPLIIEKVKQQTGRDITIDGNLSWSFFPNLGVKIGHATLSNPSAFKQAHFAELDSATMSVKVMPLFDKKIESSGIAIHGLKLNLIKNASGAVNWNFEPAISSAATSHQANENTLSPPSAFMLLISAIDVDKSTIHWIDEQKKQHIDIDQFNFSAKHIQTSQPFTTKTQFHFSASNPKMTGDVSLSNQVAVNMEQQQYTFSDIAGTAALKQAEKKFALALQGQVLVDQGKHILEVSDLQAGIANLHIILGKAKVTGFGNRPHVSGEVTIQPFDIKKLLQEIGQDSAVLQEGKNLSGTFTFSSGTTFRSVNMQGNAKIDEVKLANVRIDHIKIEPRLNNGVLTLAPITAELYQGSLYSNTSIDLNGAVPRFVIQAKLINVQAEPLLADLANHAKLSFSGAGNIELAVMTAGVSGDVLIRNLNGTSAISFDKGSLIGIDLPYWVNTAYALAQHKDNSQSNTDKTAFSTLTARAVIHNGLVTNDDLRITSAVTDTKGHGVVNLVDQQIDYQLQTSVNEIDNAKKNAFNLYGLSVPILISGSLNNPSIKLDINVLMREVGKQQLEKVRGKVQEQIQSKLLDALPSGQGNEIIKGLFGQ